MTQLPITIWATIFSRFCSGGMNYVLNRFWSFHSHQAVGGEAVRYGTLFVCQMCASAGLVALLTILSLPAILAKLLVDSCLFFLSFIIQKNWVFRREVAD